MIVMIMGRQYGVNLANGEWIEHERGGAQIGLELLHPTCHPLHLMAGFHQWIAVALLAGAAPEIDVTLAPPSDFNQMPVQPSHHMAKVPGATCPAQSLHSASYPFRKGVQDP